MNEHMRGAVGHACVCVAVKHEKEEKPVVVAYFACFLCPVYYSGVKRVYITIIIRKLSKTKNIGAYTIYI